MKSDIYINCTINHITIQSIPQKQSLLRRFAKFLARLLRWWSNDYTSQLAVSKIVCTIKCAGQIAVRDYTGLVISGFW